jgi:hypothetical protein
MRRPQTTVLTLALVLLALACSSANSIKGVQNIVIAADPASVLFTAVSVGNQDSRQVTLTHVGDEGILQITGVSIVQDAPVEYYVTEPEKTQLQPQESVTLSVTYIPQGAPRNAVLRIACNAINATGGHYDLSLEPQVQGDNIRLFPAIIDFGPVPGGTIKELPVTATNEGANPLQVAQIRMKAGADADFSLAGLPDPLPLLGAGQSVTFKVAYAPTEGDADEATLMVAWGDQEATALAKGSEISPNIRVIPGKVDFGTVELNKSYSQALTIQNAGSYKATITNISVLPGPDPAVTLDPAVFSIDGWTAGQDGVELSAAEEGDNKLKITLNFQPTAFFASSYFPVAVLSIESDDPNHADVRVDVFARLSLPDIEVVPASPVEFGFVAMNWTTDKQFTVFNKGQGDLVIKSVALTVNPTQEFKLVTDEAFGPLATTPTEYLLPADQSVKFTAQFTNTQGATGDQNGVLTITSTDPVDGTLNVDLHAARTKNPECKPVLVPAKLDYGVVPHGGFKDMTISVRNDGSGDCTFINAKINDCSSFAGMMVTCQENNFVSSKFKFLSMPAPVPNGLKPGMTVLLPVRFTPPNTASLFDFEDYPGLFTLTYSESYSSGDGSATSHKLPTGCDVAGTCQPNVLAKSGTSAISVLPDHLDFGVVTVGCYSQTMKVSLYNTSTNGAPLQVKNVYIDPTCPAKAEFKIKEVPPLPVDVNPQNPLVVKVVYHPQDTNQDQCVLIIESSDQNQPKFFVPMDGEGTFETEHTDEFTQITGQNVDILFAIDSSGSMDIETQNLADNISTFVAAAATWKNDYQIGVIGVGIAEDAKCLSGYLQNNQGDNPRIMHNSTTGFVDTAENVDSGGCAPDNQEAALEAAHLALTLPLTQDTGVACTSDATCTAPAKCVEGVCGGVNRGFIREDAALEVIAITDEQDQSPATPDFYIDFFHSIKGFANPNLFHFHAITGPEGGCSSSWGEAESGDRLIEVQSATNGIFHSICDQDYASALKDIGNIAFGLKKQFFLTRVADPSTVKVWVKGVECQSAGAWVYDQPSNSVIFDEYGSCMPQPGDAIKVWYKTVCYNS